jgi:murein DD-endopeptidase MepM/ murein hydrolase activator NlpD
MAGTSFGQSHPLRQSFDLRVPAPPTPVAIDGAPWLVYELHLTGFARESLTVTSVEVLDGSTGAVLASFAAEDLGSRFDGTGRTRTVAPGGHRVVYLEVSPPRDSVPTTLRHRVTYADAANSSTHVVTGDTVAVGRDAPVVLGPPLRGGPWAAVHDPFWERGHRRVFYAIDGRARLPGRFAIDWIRLDADGRAARGDADVVANSLGYGADVLAVADAVVAAARDDMSEALRISGRRSNPIGDASGNYVALDLGGGRYAFYEHLKPGSVRVSKGQRVRRGEVIGALGFTGDSTGPHLHLHVADASAPLAAEGLPFVLEGFTVLGKYEDVSALGSAPWTACEEPSPRRHERPAPNVVVDFGNGGGRL